MCPLTDGETEADEAGDPRSRLGPGPCQENSFGGGAPTAPVSSTPASPAPRGGLERSGGQTRAGPALPAPTSWACSAPPQGGSAGTKEEGEGVGGWVGAGGEIGTTEGAQTITHFLKKRVSALVHLSGRPGSRPPHLVPRRAPRVAGPCLVHPASVRGPAKQSCPSQRIKHRQVPASRPGRPPSLACPLGPSRCLAGGRAHFPGTSHRRQGQGLLLSLWAPTGGPPALPRPTALPSPPPPTTWGFQQRRRPGHGQKVSKGRASWEQEGRSQELKVESNAREYILPG